MEIALIVLVALAVVLLVAVLIKLSGRGEPAPAGDNLRTEFESVAIRALDDNSDRFLKLAGERFARLSSESSGELTANKRLIDQQLQGMKTELGKVSDLVQRIETEREAKFGQLTTEIKNMGQQTAALTTSTETLGKALANSRSRGQWGERMAEDVLRLMGLVEGINYQKQKAIDGGGARPDFAFFLPGQMRVNMDVKFPLDNYLKFVQTESEVEREQYRTAFLRDVRAKITEVSSREYIDPNQGTVDYVLLFIPNESVYAFIHENDPDLLDAALEKKVIWCSPLTLYCVLAVVRQAVNNLSLQKQSDEIISLMGAFKAQWENYLKSVETLGRHLTSTQGAYDLLSGRRMRALRRPLEKIEELRVEKGLPVGALDDGAPALEAGDPPDDAGR